MDLFRMGSPPFIRASRDAQKISLTNFPRSVNYPPNLPQNFDKVNNRILFSAETVRDRMISTVMIRFCREENFLIVILPFSD